MKNTHKTKREERETETSEQGTKKRMTNTKTRNKERAKGINKASRHTSREKHVLSAFFATMI